MNANKFARFLLHGEFDIGSLEKIVRERDAYMFLKGIDKGTLLEQWRVNKVKKVNAWLKKKHLNEFINQIEDYVHSEDENKEIFHP